MINNVTNSYELYLMLKQKYGYRFKCDPYRARVGSIHGSLDNKRINITFKPNNYLFISTSPTSRNILEELFPLLKEIMGNIDPICSYDLQREGLEEYESLPTIEWDVKAPESRLKDIINGRAFPTEPIIHNLKLYNSKNIEDYLEKETSKDDNKNAKIYGIYPGCIKDIEAINNLSEVNLYFYIDTMETYIRRCRNDMIHGRIIKFDITEEQYALEYMIYQTTKFGVELPKPAINKHIKLTPSYQAWYQFYSNHFKNNLTNEQWNAFKQAVEKREDTTTFMPSGYWTDLLQKPNQKTLK